MRSISSIPKPPPGGCCRRGEFLNWKGYLKKVSLSHFEYFFTETSHHLIIFVVDTLVGINLNYLKKYNDFSFLDSYLLAIPFYS